MVRKVFVWAFFALILTSVACKQRAAGPGVRPLLSGACNYLWQQQGEDGAWRSQTHKVLGGGQVLTPFILWSLLQIPDSLYAHDARRIHNGLQFIRDQIDAHGVLGYADPHLLEYPNYANAYALMVLSSFGSAEDQDRIRKLQKHLLDQQFVEHRGIFPDNWVFGGWGFGELNLTAGKSGQVDLSHTRRVLQALIGSGYPKDSLQLNAGIFLDLLQKNPLDQRIQPGTNADWQKPEFDGGFFYSPVVWGANKAGQDLQGQFRSYHTATCDGFLASKILGRPDLYQQAAIQWLEKHASLFEWDNLEGDLVMSWSQAMQYYHLMVRSEVYAEVYKEGDWPLKMRSWLSRMQLEDGSFHNPKGAISKEDDPLMATGMVLITLLNCHNADK